MADDFRSGHAADAVRFEIDRSSGPNPWHETGLVRTVREPDGLRAIREPGVDAVIWQRDLPPAVASACASPALRSLDSTRFEGPVGDVGARVSAHLRTARRLDASIRDWLAQDVARLAQDYASIMGVSDLLVRLETVRDNACRRFHRDVVRARMICAYRGPGTQYGVSQDGEQPGRFDTAATGCPVLLRGDLWPAAPDRAVLHRSPPIEGTGTTRWVIVINEVRKQAD